MRSWTVVIVCLAATSTSLARAQPCELEAVLSLRDLQVSAGTEALTLHVDEAPVVVRPSESAAKSEVEVRSSLGFVADIDRLPYMIRRRIEDAHSMVSLTRDILIDRVRAEGDDLLVRAHVGGARIDGLRARCEDIVLERARTEEAEPLEPMRSDGGYWEPRGLRLVMRPRPGAGAALIVRFRRDRPLAFARVSRRGAWMQIVWNSDRDRITGWVRRADMRPVGHYAWGSTGGSGTAGCMPMGRAAGYRSYQGPARLLFGAWVRDAPAGHVWASVRQADGFAVLQIEGARWTRLTMAPSVREGSSCGLAHAWVRSADVVLPEGAFAPREPEPRSTGLSTRGRPPPAASANRRGHRP